MATDARRAPAFEYSPQLDGLRAVSVAAVAYSHWLPAWQFGVPLGAGVHLFFVLSGFLITRILLSIRDAPDRVASVARFYARRALRLFPAFYLVLGLAWQFDVPLVRDTWPWHAAYLSNLRIATDARWMGHVSHFWSLAVEEQFYLVWPWLVVWTPRRWLAPLLGAALLAGPLARMAAASTGLGEPFWPLVPAGSADSLAAGALVAWTSWRASRPEDGSSGAGPCDGRSDGSRVWPRPSWAAIAAAAWVALALGDAWGRPAPPPLAVWRQVLQAVVFAWVVRRAVGGFGGAAGRVLAHPWTVFVGRVSYGVYLIHAFVPIAAYAIADAAGVAFGTTPLAVRAVTFAAMTVVLASAMWYLVERPVLALKRRVFSIG